ncbi:MAG: MOSC N-terminal beta barrel domain-containing protein [Pseudomonadota bacterium]
MSKQCTVVGLYAYPVKSCRGSAMEQVELTPQGIDGDRQLMILKDQQFTNQARLPKLATIETRRIDAQTIEFGHKHTSPLRHQVNPDGAETTINFYGNELAVIDQGDAVAQLVSDGIGADVRVAALKETFQRSVPLEEFAIVDGIAQSRFVDVAPILVTSVESLQDLNDRMSASVPMERFRPNVVIEGLGAFAEDELTELRINGIQLLRATHCERCAVTCTDHLTGERNQEPLATLRSYRHREGGYAGGVMFGAYMGVSGQGVLRVGDKLTVG